MGVKINSMSDLLNLKVPSMEAIDKMRFEESFKRTIVMQEQQESSMSKRIQDLTGKLLSSEKTARQLKEMMSSSSHRKHSRRSERKDSKNVESVAASVSATSLSLSTKAQPSTSS